MKHDHRLIVLPVCPMAASTPVIPRSHQSLGRKFASGALLACLGLLLALASAACSSMSGPASASFASVTIHGRTVEEIGAATTQVFQEAGYAGGSTGGMQMVFQREGSQMNNLAYEGIVGTYYGAKTAVRVRTELVSLGDESYRLQCQAYIVRGAGDSFFEEEQRLTNIRSAPYQQLLNQVANRLKR